MQYTHIYVFSFERTTKALTSLRIRNDLEITQFHQIRPAAAVGHDHFLGQKDFSLTTILGPNMLLRSSRFFQIPLDFLMR